MPLLDRTRFVPRSLAVRQKTPKLLRSSEIEVPDLDMRRGAARRSFLNDHGFTDFHRLENPELHRVSGRTSRITAGELPELEAFFPQPGPDIDVEWQRLPAGSLHPVEHPDGDETLVLALTSDRGVFLNRRELSEGELLPTLRAVTAARREKVLYLKANELLDYGWVLEKMDVCRRAGAEEVALITRESTAH